MGVFDIYSYTREGNQKITPSFLKKLGFKQSEWGSPLHWNDGHHTFWEKYVGDIKATTSDINFDFALSEFVVGEVWYYPESFEGYVTSFNSNGKNPAGAIYCHLNSSHEQLSDEYIQYPKTKMDIISYLDMIEGEVKQLNK